MTALVHWIVTLWATLLPAIDLEAGSSTYVERSGVVTAPPLTVHLWFTPESLTATGTLWSYADDAGSTTYTQMIAVITAGTLRYAVNDGGGNVNATTSNAMSVGSRYSCCIVGTSSTDRRAILNGDWANSGTNTTSRTPAGQDWTSVGRVHTSVPGNYADGLIEHVAVWGDALTQTEVESLAAGASPYNVRRGSLLSFLPFVRTGDARDLVSGTLYSGAPTTIVDGRGLRRQRAR